MRNVVRERLPEFPEGRCRGGRTDGHDEDAEEVSGFSGTGIHSLEERMAYLQGIGRGDAKEHWGQSAEALMSDL